MSEREVSGVAILWMMFAAAMLLVVGLFQMIAGLAAIIDDSATVYATVADKSYWLHLDTTTWGWTHLIIGLVLLLAGFGLFAGQVWARTVGVIVAGVSAVVAFAFIPIYPGWALVIIAVDIAVIWALSAHGRDFQKVEPAS